MEIQKKWSMYKMNFWTFNSRREDIHVIYQYKIDFGMFFYLTTKLPCNSHLLSKL